MTCSVCLDRFDTEGRVPLALPCQHTFCKKCVEDLSARSDGWLKCPTCREEFSQDQAMTNFALRDALEASPAGTLRARSRSRSPRGHVDGLPTDLTSLTVVAIKGALRERGLPVGGKKAELICRLNRARCEESQASRSAPASTASPEPPRVSVPAPGPVLYSNAPLGRHHLYPAMPSTLMPHAVQIPCQPTPSYTVQDFYRSGVMHLRHPWVGCIDPASGKPYAFNGWTNEAFWYPPPVLPLGWELFLEPASGKPYYFNQSTNLMRWDPPPA